MSTTMTFTMQTIDIRGIRPGLRFGLVALFFACAMMSIAREAQATEDLESPGSIHQPPDDHSGETLTFGFIDGIDASCTLMGSCTAFANFSNINLLFSEIIDSDFTGANFDGASFSFGDISDSTFDDATFVGAVFDDVYIEFSDFIDADFSGASPASFRRATVRAGSFDLADFTGVDLTNTQFRCITDPTPAAGEEAEILCPTFIGTNFTDADLSSALFAPTFGGGTLALSNTNFGGADLSDAIFSGIALPCEEDELTPGDWLCMKWGDPMPSPSTTVDSVAVLNCSDLRGTDMRNLAFNGGTFTGAFLAGARFEGSTFTDTTFDVTCSACDVFGDVNERCKMLVDAIQQCAVFDDTAFTDAAAITAETSLCTFFSTDEANYQAGSQTDFRDTVFTGASFDGADLSNATFADGDDGDAAGATLSGVDFSNALLDGTDFTDAVFADVTLDNVDLGCTADAVFEDDCADCAVFSGVFSDTGLVNGEYNIRMRSVAFDDILACSTLGPTLVDDLSFMNLDNSSFSGADVAVASVDFIGSSLVSANFGEADISGVDFTGADLTDADMVEAIITGSDFTDAVLINANLLDAVSPCMNDLTGAGCAIFTGADLTVATLTGGAYPFVHFDGATLDGVVAGSVRFSNATFMGAGTSLLAAQLQSTFFDGATFTDADLTDANFSSADLSGAMFTDSDLTNVNFSSADLRGTVFAVTSGSLNLSSAIFASATVDGSTSIAGSQIDGLNLSGVNLTLLSPTFFQGKVDFAGAPPNDALGVQLNSTDLTDFDLSNLELINWNFSGATIMGTDFSGADLAGANMSFVQFDLHFDAANFNMNSFIGVDFTGADWNGVNLAGFDLTGANLTSANLTGTDFTNADLSNTKLVSIGGLCPGTDCSAFTGAKLKCADLTNTAIASTLLTLVDSDLTGITLGRVSGIGRDLQSYNFTGLNLNQADLEGGDLRMANFTGATLHGARLANTTICSTSADCALFSDTDLTGNAGCMNPTPANYEASADFTGIDFTDAPVDAMGDGLFKNAIVDNSVACVDFSNANLSATRNESGDQTNGFALADLTVWEGAVLAGAELRYQDLSAMTLPANFFQELGHAIEVRDDICTAGEDEGSATVEAGPDLRATIFDCAILTDQLLTGPASVGADLRDAQFVRSVIGGMSFSLEDSQLEGANFTDVDFVDAPVDADVFQNIATVKEDDGITEVTDDHDGDELTPEIPYPNLTEVSFAYADLGGIDLNLRHVDLSQATLTGADFTDAILSDAILDDIGALCGEVATPTSQDLCPPNGHTPVTCLVLDNAKLDGVSFVNVDFTDLFNDEAMDADPANFFQRIASHSVEVSTGVFVNFFDLSGTDFTGANIAGMNFNNVDLVDAALFSLAEVCNTTNVCASFEGTTFGSSKPELLVNLAGRDFMEASLAGATFQNVSLQGVDFRDVGDVGELCTDPMDNTDCLTITGANSSLAAANFSGLELDGVSFGSGDDRVVDFRNTQFLNTDFSGLIGSLSGIDSDDPRTDFTGADFTGANLAGQNLDGAMLADIMSGCDLFDGVEACTNFDNTTMCGVDARGATFEGSFLGVDLGLDTMAAACMEVANFGGATFIDIDFDASTRFTNAILENVTFESSVSFCAEVKADCLVITGASLRGATLAEIDFTSVPDDFFADVSDRDQSTVALEPDLRQIDFTGSNLSDKNFSDADLAFADLSDTNLSGADFSNANFNRTQFALGATTNGTTCTPAGGTATDLRGANLAGADLSRALNFQRGCILVDMTTLYSNSTQFPAGFDLLEDLTNPAPVVIPEPTHGWLQGTAIALLGMLAWRRRSGRARRTRYTTAL